MNKTLTLDEILERHAEYLDRVANEMQFPDSENVDDIKQAILQWFADEVVGEGPYSDKSDEELEVMTGIDMSDWRTNRAVAVESTIRDQLKVLKAHGWKGGE